jgi:hypothetical protein
MMPVRALVVVALRARDSGSSRNRERDRRGQCGHYELSHGEFLLAARGFRQLRLRRAINPRKVTLEPVVSA